MSGYTVGIGSVITHFAIETLGREGKDNDPPNLAQKQNSGSSWSEPHTPEQFSKQT